LDSSASRRTIYANIERPAITPLLHDVLQHFRLDGAVEEGLIDLIGLEGKRVIGIGH
jgi:hypothetical protein